jgi:hypothetical protein
MTLVPLVALMLGAAAELPDLPSAPQLEVRIPLSRASLLWEREALLEERPTLADPVAAFGASTILAGLSVGAFGIFQDGGGFAHLSAAPLLLLPLIASAVLLVGHLLFGVVGSVSLNARVKQRHACDSRLHEISLALDARGRP